MDANPILAEMTRGNWVENRHRGAFVVSDAHGNIIAAVGDIDRPVFPRSAVKSMQAMAIFTSGAFDKFHLSEEELALACASHQGESFHVSGVTSFLGHLGLGKHVGDAIAKILDHKRRLLSGRRYGRAGRASGQTGQQDQED